MANQPKATARSIFLDTTSAQKAAADLEKKIASLDATIDKGTKSGKDMSKQLAELGDAKAKLQQVNDVLSKGMAPSLRELENTTRRLQRELKNMSSSNPEFNKRVAEYREATKELNKLRDAASAVKKENDSFGGKFLSFLSNNAAMIGATVGIAGIASLLTDATQEAIDAEKATARLRNTLENLGRIDLLDSFAQQAEDLAAALEYLDNDDILGVFNKLATYGKLSQNQIEELTPVIIDFAAKS